MSAVLSTFSVSDLDDVSTLDHDDLLMVSDYDGESRKCYTRKLQISSLYSYMADDSIVSAAVAGSTAAIGRAVDEKISARLAAAVADEVRRQLERDISALVLLTISANFNVVNDLLDGDLDAQQIIDASGPVV